MSSLGLPVLIGLIVAALAFDFLDGLHDTANSIATLVSTRMLRPRYAVMWAAFFNFIAFLVFGVHVARTIGVGIVSADVMDGQVHIRSAHGSDSVEPHHLVGRYTVEQFARTDWRTGGCRPDESRHRRDRLDRPADHRRLHRAVTALRLLPCAVL